MDTANPDSLLSQARQPDDAPEKSSQVTSEGLSRGELVVLVVDLVESVRLMRADELAIVRHWTRFVQVVRTDILPACAGTLVKSLGDGLMARFETAAAAAAAAARMHSHFEAINATLPEDRQMRLRAGINATHAWLDELDIYGTGVNLAARLASLAGPGETIASEAIREALAAALAAQAQPGETLASAAARDDLTSGLDASCEDLGECRLKHFSEPVRAYRIGAAGPRPLLAGLRDYGEPIDPAIAIIPFTARSSDGSNLDIGNLLADAIIWRLSRAPNLRVISRLSTSPLARQTDPAAAALSHLGAQYALSGGFSFYGERLLVFVELADTRNGRVVWNERLQGTVDDLLQPESELAHRIAQAAHQAVFDTEVERVFTQPLPTLSSYSLLLGSIRLMHRSNRGEFLMTRRILDELVHRHGRIAAPHAWLGNWYVLLTTRGWSQDRRLEATEALGATRAALERDPSDALALATEGFVHCHLLGDLDTAVDRCRLAVDVNPSHALGWLYLGVVQAFRGEAADALHATRRAIALSPLDPQRYYFESLGATAELSARNYPRAEELARSSLGLNRLHGSTWRVLTIALAAQGRIDEARGALQQVRGLDPHLTVSRYLERMPNADLETGREWARHLAAAGLPDGL
jgi:class 3 adenylate cyclase/TolB-like protein